MGKQVKDDIGFVADDQEIITPPVEEKSDFGFVPDPVKKKEQGDQLIGSLDFSAQQQQHGTPGTKPSSPPTEKNTPLNNWKGISDAAKSMNPVVGAAIDFGRKIASGFSDELPQSIAQGLEVGKSMINPGSVKEYIGTVPVDFQRYVREKENMPFYKAFDQDVYLDKYGDAFMKDTGRDKIMAEIKKRQPTVIERRKGVEKYVEQQKAEGQEKMAGATQSYKQIKNLTDLASYIGTLGGNAAYQIPLSVLTRGASSLLQESATIYDQQLDNIADKKKITRQQVIEQGLDNPAAGQAYALLAAGLDAGSASNIISAFKAGGGNMVKKWAKSVVPETVTEPVQGVLEDVGAGGELWKAITSGKRIDELAGGFIGGHAGVMGGKSQAVNEIRNNAVKTDIKSMDAAAENIEQTLNQEDDAIPVKKPDTVPVQPATTTGSAVEEGAPGTESEVIAGEEDQGKTQIPQTVKTETGEDSGGYKFGKQNDTTTMEATPTGVGRSEETSGEYGSADGKLDGPISEGTAEESDGSTAEGNVPPEQKADSELNALVESGDISRDGNKVTILTEKGGVEAKRIYEELEKSRTDDTPQSTPQAQEQSTESASVVEPPPGEQQQPDQPAAGSEITPKDVHTAAKSANVDYESQEFMAKSKELTGKEHLDDMNATQLHKMVEYITSTPKTQTGSVALDQPEEQKLSGIKKALVSQEKIDATPIEKRSMEDMLTSAKEQVDSGQVNPKAIVDEISQGNARALQPNEVAGLVYYKTQLDNKSDQLNSDLLTAIESKDIDAQTSLRPQIEALDKEIDNYHTMALKTAYEQSLAFRLRQMLLDNEYNLQTQINKYKVANNGTISPEVEKKFKQLDAELKEANDKIKRLEDSRAKSASTESLQTVRQDIQRQRERRIKLAQQRKDKINAFFDNLKEKVKSDPNTLNSFTQVVGESVARGAIEAVRTAVLAGSDIATAVQAGIDYVKEHYRGTDFDEQQFKSLVEPGLANIVPSDDITALPEIHNGKLYVPESVVRTVVEGGAKNIEEVVDQIHEIIKDTIPSASKRDIRDAITKYGETRNLSKDEINVKIREIKRVGRLVSALEDVQNKLRPLRSGLQRDKFTDQERKLQREIKEAMKDLPVDQAVIDKEWKNSLDAIKSRLKNQIADLENQIKTGEKTPKKTGVEYDEEAKELREQRDKLKAILEATEGGQKVSDEQRVRVAILSTERMITDLETRIKNQDTSAKQKSTTPVTTELKSLRERRDKLKTDYLQMEKDLGVAEKKRLEVYKKVLKKSTDRYEQRIKDQDFVSKKPTAVVLDEEGIKLRMERDKIKQQFDLEREKAMLKNRPLSEKIWDTTVDIWNLPKSFVASIDMSAPFRQGAILSSSNPMAAGRSFIEMFRQAFSENKANEWLLKLRESPEYAVMKNSKLYLAEPTTKLTAKEEQFISNLAGKIPILGPAIKASERAYTGYLNKLRVDVFASGSDLLQDQGITPESNPEAYKSLATFINNATGRGNLGGAEMAAPILNGLFFSPRYVASRLNLLNPLTYAKMPAPVRKMALKSMASYIGFTAMFISILGSAFDDLEIEWDPRSSDFAKLRMGKTRFDPWAGFQQPIRLFAQLLTGQRKSTKTGKITELSGDKFPFETRLDVAMRFIRSKLSPTASTMVNLAQGENIVGEDVTIQGEAVKNVVPLYIQDIKGIYEEEGPTGVVISVIPAFFGIGVQSYGIKNDKKTELFPNR